jgi:tRNA pseudouridine38-40 synthase
MGWFSDLLRPETNHGAPTAPAEGLILMEVGYEGLDWQVDEYSRARAGRMLATTVKERMAGAMVARELERTMQVCRRDDSG